MHSEKKLLILTSNQNTLGGVIVSLSSIIRGFEKCGKESKLKVLVQSSSFLETYLTALGFKSCLEIIDVKGKRNFMRKSLEWIYQQPREFPLLFENCVEIKIIPSIIFAAPRLRFSRPIYFTFHDLASSYNPLGNFARKVAFELLNPQAICNSHYTASHIQRYTRNIKEILYQPIDFEKFNSTYSDTTLSKEFQEILKTGKKIILTPSRIKPSGDVHDKNLFGLLPVVRKLNAEGKKYHSVIIGQDNTPNKTASHALLQEAKRLGVEDCFSILPVCFDIENYYKHADILVTLAPREPFGRTVVEAIACGIPVVGSNAGGIAEILNNFAPQWKVDPYDTLAIAQAIVNTIHSPHTPSILAQAQNWVYQECSITEYAKKIMRITGID